MKTWILDGAVYFLFARETAEHTRENWEHLEGNGENPPSAPSLSSSCHREHNERGAPLPSARNVSDDDAASRTHTNKTHARTPHTRARYAHARGRGDGSARGIVFLARCAFPFADRNRVAAVKLHCCIRRRVSPSPILRSRIGGREQTDSRDDDSARRKAGRNGDAIISVDNVDTGG